MARKPLVEAAPKYELYAEWLADEDNGLGVTYDIPADLLQIACRNYGAFQRSDVNRAANQERAAARSEAAEKPTKTAKTKAKAAPVEDDDEDAEVEEKPAKKAPAKKAAPKRATKGKAAF